jgi:cysteine-rich repeat protein
MKTLEGIRLRAPVAVAAFMVAWMAWGQASQPTSSSSSPVVKDICGNKILEKDEVCDDGNTTSGDGCRADCQRMEICGDGVSNVGEECDKGNKNSDTKPNACRTDCRIPFCGDGVVDSGEQCDDGNQDAGDSCEPTCTAPSRKGRKASGQLKPGLCGDGVINTDETCDDGNFMSNDGCDKTCQVEPSGQNSSVPPTNISPYDRPKSPSLALALSFVPGPSVGHIYTEAWGMVVFNTTVRVICVLQYSKELENNNVDQANSWLRLLAFNVLYDVIDSPFSARRYNKKKFGSPNPGGISLTPMPLFPFGSQSFQGVMLGMKF